MGSRLSKSSIFISLSFLTLICSSVISRRLGIIFTWQPVRRQVSASLRITLPDTDGMAMIISSTHLSLLTATISSVVPSTGKPERRLPCLRTSSSIKPTMLIVAASFCSISRTIMAPASPAPTISTCFFCTPPSSPSERLSQLILKARRLIPTLPMDSIQDRT